MMANPAEQAMKILLTSMVILVGLAGYIYTTHDTSRGVLICTGAVSVFVFVASLLEIRRDPWSYLQVVTVVALLVAIFAGVLWWNLKTPALAWMTAAASPLALGLGIWSVLGKKPGGGR